MAWIQKNRLFALLNLTALGIMVSLIPALVYQETSPVFNTSFEACGLWAIRFLLFSLAMTPLNTYFGWRSGIGLRKSAGLWAFGFAVLHASFYIVSMKPALETLTTEPYYILGILGISILSVMAITSNRWAMKWMGKAWKRLHRLVYIAGIAVALHAIIAFSSSKKAYFGDPLLQAQLTIYLAIMVILLAVRLPLVKASIKTLQTRTRTLPAR